MIRLKTLTQGALRDLLQCEELFRLKRLARLRSPEFSPPLVAGSSVHIGIEKRSATAAMTHYMDSMGGLFLHGDEEWEAQMGSQRVFAMVEAALNRWGDDWPDEQEVEFGLDFINPATGGRSPRHVYRGVIDGYPGPGGSGGWVNVLGEWKTAASPGDAYFDRLRIDWQVSAYCEAASRIQGQPVREVRYRVIQKPTIRPSRGEDEATYRARCAERKPLAPLKQRKTETDEQYAARSEAREAKRPPLKRKVRDTRNSYLDRLRRWYGGHGVGEEIRTDRLTEVRVTRTEEQMERWRFEAWELHRRALEVERAHNAAEAGEPLPSVPIRNDSRCNLYGVRCAFLSLCSGLVGPEAYRVIPTPYPELRDGDHFTDTRLERN